MKSIQKSLSFLLAICMLLSCVPIVASAAETANGTCGPNATWSFDETTGTLTISGTGEMNNYGGMPVPWKNFKTTTQKLIIDNGITSIGNKAFQGLTNLTKVIIPDSVTSIGNSSFHNCTKLAQITLPDAITTISDTAFANTAYYVNNANWENNVLYVGNHLIQANTSLTGSYEIKEGTKTIANGAFAHCVELTKLTIPNSVITIGALAFQNCTKLTDITIGNSVTTIGDSAFKSCNSLTNIIIPDSVTKMDMWIFGNCTSLSKITLSNSITSISDMMFENCTSLIEVNIPNSVTAIGSSAFKGCTNLTKVEFSNKLTEIGSFAFSDCTNLTNVVFPNTLTTIGQYAFNKCQNLSTVIIPASVSKIEQCTFAQCTSLTDITLYNEKVEISYAVSSIPSFVTIHAYCYNGEVSTNYKTALNYAENVNNNFVSLGNHTYSTQKITKAATPTEQGEITHFCKCGDSYIEYFSYEKAPIIKINLDNTNVIYVKYGVGFYSDETATAVITKINTPEQNGQIFRGYYTGKEGKGTQIIDKNGNILVDNTYFGQDAFVNSLWSEPIPVVSATLTGSKYNFNFVYNEETGVAVAYDENGNVFDISKLSLKAGNIYYCYPAEYPDEYVLFTCTDEKLPDEFAEYFSFTGPYLKCDMGLYAGIIDNQLVVPFLEEDIALVFVQAYPEKVVSNSQTYYFVSDKNVTEQAYFATDNNGNTITSSDITFEPGKEYCITIPDYGTYTAIYTNEEIDTDIFDTYDHVFDGGYWLKGYDPIYDEYCILGFENGNLIWPKYIYDSEYGNSYGKNTYDIYIGEYVDNVIKLQKGETLSLNYMTTPADADYDKNSVTFTTEDTNVATITENNTLKASNAGNTVLTLSFINADGTEFKTSINISVYKLVESVSATVENSILLIGETTAIETTINTTPEYDNSIKLTTTYKTLTPEIATVDSEGIVTGINDGDALIKIIVTDNLGNETITHVTTTIKPILVNSIIVTNENVKDNTLILETKNSETLSVIVGPDNATDKTVTYSSSDENVAIVDKNGEITAIKAGKAIITITAADTSEIKTEINVEVLQPVTDIEIIYNGKLNNIKFEEDVAEIMVNVLPDDATNKNFTYTVSENLSAKREGTVLTITAIKEGTATLTITTEDGFEKTFTFNIESKPVVEILVDDQVVNTPANAPLNVKIGDTSSLFSLPNISGDYMTEYEVSDESVVKVDENGNLVAVGKGTATVTAKVTLENGTVITKEIVVESKDPNEGKFFCSFCDDYEAMKDSAVGFIYTIIHFFVHMIQSINFAT